MDNGLEPNGLGLVNDYDGDGIDDIQLDNYELDY